jgi:hypothetical protein
MKIHRLIVAAAAVMLCTPAVSFEGSGVQARYQDTVRSQSYNSPWQRIEERAKLENPTDGNSVRALVDEIIDYPHSFGEIPPVMNTIVKERLTQAEMNYKLGRGPGVEGSDIVRIVNTLADKFQLPDYARTTPHQAEVLCFGAEISMPTFMGVPSAEQGDNPARADPRKLSPAQATYLLLELVEAKLLSPEYQLPPDEWEKTQYGPLMEKLTKYKELKESGQLSKLEAKVAIISSSSQSGDLRTAVSKAISQMSLTDGLDLVDQAFAAVGIGK